MFNPATWGAAEVMFGGLGFLAPLFLYFHARERHSYGWYGAGCLSIPLGVVAMTLVGFLAAASSPGPADPDFEFLVGLVLRAIFGAVLGTLFVGCFEPVLQHFRRR